MSDIVFLVIAVCAVIAVITLRKISTLLWQIREALVIIGRNELRAFEADVQADREHSRTLGNDDVRKPLTENFHPWWERLLNSFGWERDSERLGQLFL
jgi:hypothetical protein